MERNRQFDENLFTRQERQRTAEQGVSVPLLGRATCVADRVLALKLYTFSLTANKLAGSVGQSFCLGSVWSRQRHSPCFSVESKIVPVASG